MIDRAATHKDLILASASPRRAQLLREAGYSFRVVEPRLNEPEHFGPQVPPHARAEALSFFKARSVMKDGAEGLIIGADTLVAYSGEVFGKPADRDDARRILERLAGTTQQVITGITLIDTLPDTRIITHCVTNVTMRAMSAADIERYLETDRWKGKAGAYGIQESDDAFVTAAEGSFSNVVGLPMELLDELLVQSGNLL